MLRLARSARLLLPHQAYLLAGGGCQPPRRVLSLRQMNGGILPGIIPLWFLPFSFSFLISKLVKRRAQQKQVTQNKNPIEIRRYMMVLREKSFCIFRCFYSLQTRVVENLSFQELCLRHAAQLETARLAYFFLFQLASVLAVDNEE